MKKHDLARVARHGVAAAVLVGFTSATDAQLFNERQTYLTTSESHSLVTGDFDGRDGPDIAVAETHLLGTTFTVFLNDGTGVFDDRSEYVAGPAPNGIVAADLTGHGNLDLATANQGGAGLTGDVRAFRNDGHGLFAFNSGIGFVPARSPWALAAADFDKGKAKGVDLAVANYPTNDLFILFNDGNGKFLAPFGLYAVGTGPRSVATADVDRDGDQDVVVACYASRDVWICLNDGGTFDCDRAIGEDGGPVSVVAADLDGRDGPDLIVATQFPVERVLVHLNDGSGAFPTSQILTRGLSPEAIATADFNCDGRLDFAVANNAGDDVSVFLNSAKSKGSFNFDDNYRVGDDPNVAIDSPDAITAADFNRDGAPDLAVANHISRSMTVLFNVGCGPHLVRVCRAAKLVAVGKKANNRLKCHAQAAKGGSAADSTCLSKAEVQLAQAFTKAEGKGGCSTTGDASVIETLVDLLTGSLATQLVPSAGGGAANACASAKLTAAGQKANGQLKCHAQATKKGTAVDSTCLSKVDAQFTQGFTKAEAKGGCATSGDATTSAAQMDAFTTEIVGRF